MIRNAKLAADLMRPEPKGKWVVLVAMSLVVSGFEVGGAFLVYSLLGLVADPDQVIAFPVVPDILGWFGVTDPRHLLIGVVATMAGFFVARSVASVVNEYLESRTIERVGVRLSSRLFDTYVSWPYHRHLRKNSSELIRNVDDAVHTILWDVLYPLLQIVGESVLILGLLTLLVVVAPLPTLLVLAVVGVVALTVLWVVVPRTRRLGAEGHQGEADSLNVLQQSFQGIRDIKLFGREEVFSQRFRAVRERLAHVEYLHTTLATLPRTAVELSLLVFILGYFAVAVLRAGDAWAPLPVLGLFAYAGLRLEPSLQRLVSAVNSIRFADAAMLDVHADVMGEVGVAGEGGPSVGAMHLHRDLRLIGVGFRYEGADTDALNGIDLVVSRGEQVGICGPTGGGKSTLLDIVVGLLVPTQGSVTVDGRDIHDDVAAWQRAIGVVSQTIFLTDDSLQANIAFGVDPDKVDEEALREALALSQLEGFVASLPEGLSTVVGERGVRVSGGQRQRVAIARALYRRPSLLVFDEGTSALDNEVEAALMSAIEELRGERTVLFVAHRLSTVKRSDRVVMLEGGRIEAVGRYDELRNENARFRALAQAGEAGFG